MVSYNIQASILKRMGAIYSKFKYIERLKINSEMPVTVVSSSQYKLHKYHKVFLKNFTSSKHLKLKGSHHVHTKQPYISINLIK